MKHKMIRNVLEICNLNDKLNQYRKDWTKYTTKMLQNRIPKLLLVHNPIGRRNTEKMTNEKETKDDQTKAVSYTHLDVYKRQDYCFLNYIKLNKTKIEDVKN